MENWIQEQAARNSGSFDAAMLTEYPEARDYVLDPERYFARARAQCNYLEAARLLDWQGIIPPAARILDLAGGTGWLSAYLSTFSQVGQITIVDASSAYLQKNLPVSVRRLGGNLHKIRAVVGYFAPLLFPDASLDLVVVSSSLHHADNLEAVLKEIHRVLVPGGKCLILNEAPVGTLFYLRSMLTTAIRTFGKTLAHRFTAASPSISASGILYDPVLGDRMFPHWYWAEAIGRAGFVLERKIDTGMATVKNTSGNPLVHFICAKTPV